MTVYPTLGGKPQAVRIIEVGPRDGLQNISQAVPTATKVELIARLQAAGLQAIELTSAVSPKAVPQLADNQKLLSHDSVKALLDQSHLRLPVLVPNTKGLDIALRHGVKEVAVFVSASEGFSRANTNCTVAEGIDRARSVARAATSKGLNVRGYVSSIFACPYDGPTPHSAVLRCVRELLDMGCHEVSLGDTIGAGAAADVRALLDYLFAHGVPAERLAGHFHDTGGQAVSNVWEAYKCGLRAFDSSVAGLGGCPYAPGAKGNVATEDLTYLFEHAGISTGVDFAKLVETGRWISQQLSRPYDSRAGAAFVAQAERLAKERENKQNKKSEQQQQQAQSQTAPERLPWTPHASVDGLSAYRHGANLKIVLNRPRNGNALTEAMTAGLAETFRLAASDKSIARIAITATGRFFCTGMDLARDSTSVSRSDPQQSAAQFDRLTRLFELIDGAPQVTVACLNGPAYGGGVGLAFACDVRIAAKEATVTLSEVKLGLCPATISKYVAREWGPAFAREAMLSGRPVSPAELKSLGVVAAVVEERERLDEVLDAYLARLRGAAPRASALCKDLVRLSVVDSGGEVQARGIRAAFDEMMGPESEAAFGVREFQAGRRKVDWDKYSLSKNMPRL
ncbi:hypothetical protein MPH_06175 [Macrophomina phaseolina MS6]|uniref:hydroxymethylglutaryl-CoA lyase n=1 Tax=Macrophomina phaseolina (strain MS6) TaxID=1126212 RepID=K2S283_MACPH|nr:hypothetical protein MPH_06175 [Macrophomina phaseolina MS6]